MTVVETSYKTSVNIKFDLGKEEYFQRYLPTPSHAESLYGLLKGFNDNEYFHSHIIIGPYGTGKSLLGTIVSGIASKRIKPAVLNELKQKFKNVDDQIYKQLNYFKKNKKKYIPIVLSGYEGKFRHVVISSILRTLKEYGIEIPVQHAGNKVLQSVEIWELHYPKAYRAFKKLLEERNTNIDLWRIEILSQNRKEIDWFAEIFPTLTNGSEFVVDYGKDFIWQLKIIIDELSKLENIGLFLVYDEFGRFLNNLDVSEIHETMQDLQDIAELADHYTDNLHILFISHKNLRHYFLHFNEEYHNEFQRIEKRYKIYHITSDQATFVRITNAMMKNIVSKSNLVQNDLEKMKHELRKYPLFPELNQVEIENIVIKGTYPIHPVALFLLPHLSNVFGQNERTLFTFLESNDTGGLLNHVKLSNEYYFADKLFNYFFSDIELADDIHEKIKLYKKILTTIPEIDNEFSVEKDEIRILKFITLWELAALQSKFKLTTDFIAFALQNGDVLERCLSFLEMKKAIRYNRIQGYWELFEGSTYNIDQLIEEKLHELTITKKSKLSVLQKFIERKYYLPNEYNDEKSMTRFASVSLIMSSDVLFNEFTIDFSRKEKFSDAKIFNIVVETSDHLKKLLVKLKTIKDKRIIFCIPPVRFEQIENQIIHYQVIQELLQDNELIMSDKNLRNELIVIQEDMAFEIKCFLKNYSSFSSDLYWINAGKSIEVNSEIVLENLLSKIMFELFPNTPEVRNDSFNRRKINTVQRKAGYKVIDSILQFPDEEAFNIEGQGPDYLIYATIFKNNKLDINNLDDIKNEHFRLLRNKLINVLSLNTIGNFQKLVSVLTEKPFGIREPLIPIYLVSLLRDKWDNLMFYRNDMYISNITGETFYSMTINAHEFQYVYFEIDEKYEGFLQVLEQLLNEMQIGSSDRERAPLLIRASSSLLRWLRSLPRFTQISNNMENSLVQLKQIIRQTEVDPKIAIEQLYHIYSNDIGTLRDHMNQLNSYIDVIKNEIIKFLYDQYKINTFEELKSWAGKQNIVIQKENNLVSSIVKAQNISELLEGISNKLVGISIKEWSDVTFETFKNQLRNEINNIDSNRVNDANYIKVNINGIEKGINKVELSPKSKSILNNLKANLNVSGRNLPKSEVEYLVYLLFNEFVE